MASNRDDMPPESAIATAIGAAVITAGGWFFLTYGAAYLDALFFP